MSTPDFDKLFSTNSPSTPFTWSDADYLEGWSSIKNTPPSRQQFDALQMISDLKSKYLMDYKAPKHSPVFTGDPQAPTPSWNDNDKSIATTAFVKHWVGVLISELDDNGIGITSSSFGQNGYVRFKNGFIIQWGPYATGSNWFATWTFPISFPNRCCGVHVSGDEATQADWHKILQGAPLSNSSFEIAAYDVLTGAGVPADVMWMLAIGY